MSKPSISDRTSPDSINRDPAVKTGLEGVGGWLFKHRTSIPIPISLAIIVIPSQVVENPAAWVTAGLAVIAAGEAIRLWAVHHIGVISRTRSDRLGPLVASGPFALVRNPLYLGNIALWVGFALAARLLWLAPIALVLLAAEYHAIVRWEERLLESRIGEAYREYCRRVPRWIPAVDSRQLTVDRKLTADQPLSTVNCQLSTFSWSETFFSERGTLVAIAAGCLLLWLKARS